MPMSSCYMNLLLWVRDRNRGLLAYCLAVFSTSLSLEWVNLFTSPGDTMEVPVEESSPQHFVENLYPKRRPVIIRGADIGECRTKWTPEYLSEQTGEREVKVHVSPTANMDFINKNFAYRSLPFGQLVKRASEETHKDYFFQEDEKYYLRSLGDDPRKDVADIRLSFPNLANDIKIPDYFNPDRFFSSVFRIGSKGVRLWTHYDIMDNILIQVNGSKRVVLFPPSDANSLYLKGDKSEVLDIENPDLTKYPDFAYVHRYECILQAGDILFIPALWFHNVITLDFGVAVNVFWKHLDDSFYDNKDPYGNKDLVKATRALQIADNAMKLLEDLPDDYKDFYARRIVIKLQNKCYNTGKS